jgi:hypothetical protein
MFREHSRGRLLRSQTKIQLILLPFKCNFSACMILQMQACTLLPLGATLKKLSAHVLSRLGGNNSVLQNRLGDMRSTPNGTSRLGCLRRAFMDFPTIYKSNNWD